MMILSFLYKLAEVLRSYFDHVNDESIRDNFVIIHELLDEVMDFGYPQNTETAILRQLIHNGAHKLTVETMQVPKSLTNQISWRREGIVYRKNEVFLDVIEKVNLLVNSNGNVVRSEIVGALKMRCELSGMPELRLGINDRGLLDALNRNSGGTARPSNMAVRSVDLEDIQFHQCVRLAKFDHDRTITFVPPDGEFNLMTYRMSALSTRPLIWVECNIKQPTESRIEFSLKAKAQYKNRSVARFVDILVPVPCDAQRPNFQISLGSGSAKYLPDQEALLWQLTSFEADREAFLEASFSLPSVANENRHAFKRRPITVKFELPYFVVSGLTVRYLKITDKSGYAATPWVRHSTQNGDYEIRIA